MNSEPVVWPQSRPQRRDEEMAPRVGHADQDSGDAHQQHVGEHQAQKAQHQLCLFIKVRLTEEQGRRNPKDCHQSQNSGRGENTRNHGVGAAGQVGHTDLYMPAQLPNHVLPVVEIADILRAQDKTVAIQNVDPLRPRRSPFCPERLG